MKKLALFLMTVLLTSATVFTSGQNREVIHDDSVRFRSGCEGPKQEQTSNGVQVRLEICGSDLDGWDLDAVNPDSDAKWECTCKFNLKGTTKAKDDDGRYKDTVVEISRERKITVTSTRSGWFNADGEAGIKEGRKFNIMDFSVSCSSK